MAKEIDIHNDHWTVRICVCRFRDVGLVEEDSLYRVFCPSCKRKTALYETYLEAIFNWGKLLGKEFRNPQKIEDLIAEAIDILEK